MSSAQKSFHTFWVHSLVSFFCVLIKCHFHIYFISLSINIHTFIISKKLSLTENILYYMYKLTRNRQKEGREEAQK